MKTTAEYSPDEHEHFASLCRMILRSPSAVIQSSIHSAVLPLELIAMSD